MTQLSYQTPTGPINDRRTRLLVMGILLLLTGGAIALSNLFGLYGLRIPRPPGLPQVHFQNLIFPVLMVAASVTAFISAGVGSIMRRRWCRPLVLALAWCWLTVGIVMTTHGAFNLVRTLQVVSSLSAGGSPAYGPAFTVNVLKSIASPLVIYVMTPLLIILMYKPDEMQATLDFYDRSPRWTDGLPIRALGLCVFMLWTSGMWLSEGSMGLFPYRGGLVIATVVIVCFMLLASWWMFQLRARGWWMALVLFVLVASAKTVLAFMPVHPEMYLSKNLSAAELDQYVRLNAVGSAQLITSTLLSGLIGVGYLLYARSAFFNRPLRVMPVTEGTAPPFARETSQSPDL